MDDYVMPITVLSGPPHNQGKYPSRNKLSDPNIVGKLRCHPFIGPNLDCYDEVSDISFME